MADLPGKLVAYLSRRKDPCSSLHLADLFLKLGNVDEPVATRLLAPILEPLGFAYSPQAGWTPGGKAAPAAPEGPAIAQVACAVSLGVSQRSRTRAIRAISARTPESEASFDTAARGDGSRIAASEWTRLSRILDGAEAIFLDPRTEAPPLLAELERRGLPRPAGVRSLLGSVRGAARIPRPSRPEEIAAALGAPWIDEDSAGAAASNIAACLRAARDKRAAGAGRGGGAAEARDLPAASVFTPSLLAQAPSSPGIYRFLGDGGELIYVGKSSNLKRRLASYAAEAAGGRESGRKVIRDLHRVRSVEWRATGSDLAAILEEARVITSMRPSANVQRSVHERGARYAASRILAYLLPGAEPGAIVVLFVRHGVFEGIRRVGPRGGGLAEALRLASGLWGKRAGGAETGKSTETKLAISWLARHGEGVSRVELDACRSARHAVEALEHAIREMRSDGAGTSYHR